MSSSPSFVLFCKTYSGDLRRLVRLLNSVERHNTDRLPMVVSTPAAHQSLFMNAAGTSRVTWVCDEDIIAAQPGGDSGRYAAWDGRLSQQVIKAEFWRLGVAQTYLCLDADSEFIRDFSRDDFVCPMSGGPFTVMSQAKELLQFADNRGLKKIRDGFFADSATIKSIFNRQGPDFDFGPTPAIWSSRVWQALYDDWLAPRGMDFWDAIEKFPAELRWYGEALLKFRPIELIPIEPLFRVYHYDWQFYQLRAQGETPDTLRKNYLGRVMQSNWEFELDWADGGGKRKSAVSRLARRLRRLSQRLI